MSRDWDWAIKAHQNFSKNSEGQDDEQCIGELISHCSSNSESTPNELIPGSILQLADGRGVEVTGDDGRRKGGSILQNGNCLYIVIGGNIINRHGKTMYSPPGYAHYHKVGRCYKGDFCVTNWFHEDMLQLRR